MGSVKKLQPLLNYIIEFLLHILQRSSRVPPNTEYFHCHEVGDGEAVFLWLCHKYNSCQAAEGCTTNSQIRSSL